MVKNLNEHKSINHQERTFITSENEIELAELLSAIWQGKKLIMLVCFFFAFISSVYVAFLPNIYKAEALLAPVEQESKGGLSALAGQFGGLASLAGVSLGSGGGVDKTQMAIEVMKSRQFTSIFINKYEILPDLIASKSWDSTSNTITYDETLYRARTGDWVREVEWPYTSVPSQQEAYKKFREAVSINIDKEIGMVTISVEHISPFIANKWVNWLIKEINEAMKLRDVVEANKSREFLTNQIQKTKVADIRSVLYKLIEDQTKTIMFANVRDEYVFKTIDPAIIPEESYKPNRILIVIMWVMIAGMLSILYVLIRCLLVRKK